MRPLPRIRKAIKWGGAVVIVLLVTVWAGSGWWWVSVLPTQRHWLTAKCGAVALSDDSLLVQMSALLPSVVCRPPPPPDRFEWWLSDTGARSSGSSIGIARFNTRTRTLTVLLWPFIILVAGATGAA